MNAGPHPIERGMRRLWLARGFRAEWHDTPLGKLHGLAARGTGERPGVVAVHGIGSGALPFLPVLHRLRPEVRFVAAIESPGHGFSDPPRDALTPASWQAAVHGALDAQPAPFVLVGNSLGGALAMRYALQRPERLAGLVLCAPAGAPLDDAGLERLRQRFAVPTDADARQLVRDLFARPPWYAGLVGAEIGRRLRQPYLQGFLAAVGTSDFLTVEEVAALRVPTLLLWGTGERLLPPELAAWYRTHLPDCVRFEQPDAGHIPQVERPRWLADRLRAFVANLPG
jgi:pimeloyl-ACP methyl ester carboxylesterase